MKRKLAMLLVTTLIAIPIAGCGGSGDTPTGTPPESQTVQSSQPTETPVAEPSTSDGAVEKTIHIYTNRTESHVAYMVWLYLIEKYQKEINPGFSAEFETVPNLDQYKDKLKLYIAGDDLPEIFQIDKGPISMEVAAQNKAVDIAAELKRLNMYDLLNDGCRAYVEHEDGGLYILPEARYGNAIFYWKDKFDAAGVQPPTTFDEMLDVCQKLKDIGEIPMGITGKVSWNPLHIMYMPSWRVTNNEWLGEVKRGDKLFSDIPTVKDGAEFLYNMGTNGYFPPGFGNMEYTDIMNGFLGEQYAMIYCQSIYLPQFQEAYDAGKLDYFHIPDNAKYDNRYSNMPIHTGISWAFNAETYDEEMQRFFDFVIENYSEACYANNIHSPFDVDPPDDWPEISKKYYEIMKQQKYCWSNWDDACDPATGTLMGQLGRELVQGMITPDQFIAELDESIKENGVPYFAQQ